MSLGQAKDLHRAICSRKCEDIREILSKNPELVNHRTKKHKISPLWRAMLRGYEEIVELLILEFGAEPDEKFADYTYLQHAARRKYSIDCFNNYLKVSEVLIRHGADIHASMKINVFDSTDPFQIAIFEGCTQFVEMLLKNGVELEHTSRYGRSAQVCVFNCKNITKLKEMLILLLKYGLDTKFESEWENENLLHCYIRYKIINADYDNDDDEAETNDESENYYSTEIAEILLDAGIPINQLDELGYSPLHLALELEDIRLVSFLIERGADVNMKHNEISPLIMAVETDDDDFVELLISHGAEVNAKMDDGKTALHIACYESFDHQISTLIEKGADVNLEDKDGNTPFSQLFVEHLPNNNSIEVVIQEIARLHKENLPVSRKDLALIQEHPDQQRYFELCLDQLSEMAKAVFYPPYSYYSVLKMSKNIKKLANLTKNAEFVDQFELLLPIDDVVYKNNVMRIFNEAVELKDQNLNIYARLYSIFKDFFPDVILRKLADNIAVTDLPLD